MLQGFRAGSRSLLTQIVLMILMGLLIISFGFWGISGVFRGFGSQTVAKVGSTEIRIEDYRRAFNERLQEIGRQINRPFTADQARALGIDRQVLSELVSEAALNEKTRSLGLAVTDQTVKDRVMSFPSFKGADGNFDPVKYQVLLRNNNFTEATYLAAEKNLAVRQQLLSAIGGEVVPPKVLTDAFWRLQSETRAIEYIRLAPNQAGTIPAPSEADLKTYFEANKAGFRAPEYRALRILHLTPAMVAKDIVISDDDLKKTYETVKERLTIPERRQIEQVSFGSIDVAKAASERLAKGETLETVAKDLKLQIVSLGSLAKTEILDAPVAQAAFGLELNTASQPVAGRFGPVILRVTKIDPQRTPSFEEVSKSLREDLQLRRAITRVQDLHDKIEDERGAGSTIEEIGKKLNIAVITVDAVDRSGAKPDGTKLTNLPAPEQLLSAAFATQKNVEADAIELREQRSTIWFEVVDIKVARDRTFEEAKSAVEARWKDEQTGKKLTELAAAIQKKLDEGATFADAAPNAKVEKAEKLNRSATIPGIDANTVARVFLTANGKSGVGIADSTSRIVFRVTSVDLPTTPPPAQLVQQITQSVQEDLQVQYVSRLQTDLGLSVNEALMRQVTGAGEQR
ncbi:MAG: SurA N-terminal domain-containing protein [Xanthobacteraceae bacterium]|nr:SurA N-terminal domain-containing protein [Xanthobacteraceae bacterium]MBX3547638.1 SurA N-terminal domain-containing protein [Xanthobacteraceae bacterium]MCW5674892.1 SurA N-terminal domain-containing protein [Xanthobacteraceae bacterium]